MKYSRKFNENVSPLYVPDSARSFMGKMLGFVEAYRMLQENPTSISLYNQLHYTKKNLIREFYIWLACYNERVATQEQISFKDEEAR